MPKVWKWKAILLAGLTLLSVYLLYPTFFKLPEGKSWYKDLLPDKTINLGLDLRGGTYLEFEVMTDKAVENQLDVMSEGIRSDLKEKGIADVDKIEFKTNKEEAKVVVTGDEKALDAIFDIVMGQGYRDVLGRPVRSGNTLTFGYNDVYLKNFNSYVIEQALAKIRNRIDRYGVTEPTIQRLGSGRIAVELPGMKDPERAVEIIKQAGILEFKIVDSALGDDKLLSLISEGRKQGNLPDDYSYKTVAQLNKILEPKLPKDTEIAFELEKDQVTKKTIGARPYLLKKRVWVTGDMLKDAKVSVSENEPHVTLTLNNQGAKLFGEATANNVGQRMAILLDGTVTSAPVINEPIYGGGARITMGRGSYDELRQSSTDLVLVLQEGALPAPLVEAAKTVVGPTLGSDSIRKGITATVMGSALVFLFMLIYYKGGGLWADIALVFNLLFILAALVPFQATLTLPGIAGIVLTLGMAVDANVLILERIKEELRGGKSVPHAISAGYSNAMRTIIDANVTTLIAAVVLYQFGTGPVKGFAVTLMIGLLISMYTACVCTRMIYDYLIIKRRVQKISV